MAEENAKPKPGFLLSTNERVDLIIEITSRITKDVVMKIAHGKIPDSWNELQLREYLAEQFWKERRPFPLWKRRLYTKQKKEGKL